MIKSYQLRCFLRPGIWNHATMEIQGLTKTFKDLKVIQGDPRWSKVRFLEVLSDSDDWENFAQWLGFVIINSGGL